jgi:glutaredoxin-related protein
VENKNTNESSSIDSQSKTKIDDFVKSNKIAIFIKGEPDAPRMIKVFLSLEKKNNLFLIQVVGFPMLSFKYLIYMDVILNQKIF